MRKHQGVHWPGVFAGGYVVAYALACFAVIRAAGFYVLVNDYRVFDVLGRMLDWRQPMTLANGLHPFGYLVILWSFWGIFGTTHVPAICLSIVSGSATLWAVWRYGQRLIPWGWCLGALIATSLVPSVMMYSVTPTGDALLMALGTWAVFQALTLLHDSIGPSRLQIRRVVGIALLTAIAGTIRPHGMALGFGIMLMLAVLAEPARRTPWRFAVILGACIVWGGFGVQAVINLWAGRPAWENVHALNLHYMMYGVNWYHLPHINPSPVALVLQDPLTFLRTYGEHVSRCWSLLVVVAVNLLLAEDRRSARLHAALLGIGMCYLAVVVKSPERAPLPLIPLLCWEGAILLRWLWAKWRRHATATFPGILLAITLLAACSIPRLWSDGLKQTLQAPGQWRKRFEAFTEVETRLRRDGVSHAGQVFSASFDLYFPSTMSYPYVNGGWLRFTPVNHNRWMAELRTQRLDDFIADCRRFGMTHVVLIPYVKALSDDLFAIYTGERDDRRLQFIAVVEEMKLYRVSPL